MKKGVKLLFAVVVIAAIVISPRWFTAKTVKVKNITLASNEIESVKAVNRQFQISEYNRPSIEFTRDIAYDPYGKNLYYLHFSSDMKEWILTSTETNGKVIDNINLGIHKQGSIGLGKVCFDKNGLYIGVDEMLILIKRGTHSVKKISFPKEKYSLEKKFVPNRNVNDHSFIDMVKVGKYIVITRNNSRGILLFNTNRARFEEWKLPEKFGSVNKVIKFDENNVFITNLYSGKGNYLLQDQFGKLNLRTGEFDIFSQPVQKLFVLKNKVWGVDFSGNLFVLDNELKHIKSYKPGIFIISDVVPANGKIWFVGSDTKTIGGTPLVSNVSDNAPTDTITVIGLKTVKKVLFIGCFDPDTGIIEKSYLPVGKPTRVIGVYGADLDKINSEFKSSIVLPSGIVGTDTDGVFIFETIVMHIKG